MTASAPARARCWRCDAAIDAGDRYCRACGEGQGAHVAWYYRPLGIALLTLAALGPLSLPLVWRSPRLGRNAKIAASVAILAFTVYVVWTIGDTLEEVGALLGGP